MQAQSKAAMRAGRPVSGMSPVALTSLIGREADLAALRQRLLDGVRLLTLTGAAGSGKTRMALAVAAGVETAFAAGAVVVDLAPLRDPNLVIPAIARALVLQETSPRPILEVVEDRLRDEQLLLVLDNFEHLVAAAPQVAEVLEACSRLQVLATSREPLRLSGEQLLLVPPLALPDPNSLGDLAATAAAPAVALFVERARALAPAFALTEENAGTVAEICRRLDGLPLAIELAAAWIRLLAPAAILRRLDQRLGLLTGGPRDLPARQQTLRAALAWSFDLLSPEEQAFFRRLGVFAGGWTLAAAEAIAGNRSRPDVAGAAPEAGGTAIETLDRLTALVEKNLVQVREVGPGETRFAMLETVREYALERLEAEGEFEQLQRRHAEYFCTLAEEAEPHLRSHEQLDWLDRLEAELENLRAALAAAQLSSDGAMLLRLAASLWRFWLLRGYYHEGRAWLEQALSVGGAGQQTSARAAALHGASMIAALQSNVVGAFSLVEEVVTICREQGIEWSLAHGLAWSGHLTMLAGEPPAAGPVAEESLARFRALEDDWGIAYAESVLGYTLFVFGDAARGWPLLEAGLAHFRETGDRWGIGFALQLVNYIAFAETDYARARVASTEMLVILEELRWEWGIGIARTLRARAAHQIDPPDVLAAMYRDSLSYLHVTGDVVGVAAALDALADLCLRIGQPLRAARLFGATAAAYEATSAGVVPAHAVDRERTVAAARAAGEAAFAAAWNEGHSLRFEAAVADALALIDELTTGEQQRPPAAAVVRPDRLTVREIEVLRLLAAGQSNQEIADALGLSPGTVARHTANIYTKLNVRGRAEAVAYALAHGILET